MIKDKLDWLKTIWKKPDKYADLKKFPVLSELSSLSLIC